MERRDFLKLSGKLILVSSSAPFFIRCGKETGSTGDVTITSSSDSGHTHNLTISAAQLAAGDALTLNSSSSGHSHTVDLTANAVTSIANGDSVQVTTGTTNAHTHTYTFNSL